MYSHQKAHQAKADGVGFTTPKGFIEIKRLDKRLYNCPLKSTKLSISPTISCLHQKYKRLILFILIFWKQLAFPSKHLSFLSFHKVHQTHAGILLHQSTCDPLLPTPSQLFNISKEVLGITQLIPSKQKNMFHRFTAVLQ